MPSNPKVEAPLALVQKWTLSAAATLGSSVRAKVRYARAPHMSTNAAVALLLEDEPLISMDLEQTLQGAGFDVTTVISCAEAEECLAAHQPDIVIVEIRLRDRVVQRLIEAHIPFVVHSGDHPSEHSGTPFEHGAWVAKPAAPDDLIGATKALLAA